MKKRILSLLLLLTLSLSACQSDVESKDEQSGELSSVEILSSTAEEFENAESVESVESVESSENSDISDVSESSEASESTESVESSESISALESSVSIESTETVNSSEEESSEETPSVPDSSYEVMDTPIIPVPETVESSSADVFFNDSVFVGNSIMLGFSKFTNSQRAGSVSDFLGTAKFFCAGDFGIYHNNRTPASSSKASNPTYAGKKYSVEDAVGVMGAKTVYLNLMGLNDLALYGDSKNCSRKCADDVIKLIKTINDRYPHVNVVVLSATYLTASRNNYPSLNNKNLSLMNNYLLDYCNENGLDFIDIASQLTENGCLADKYASDGYCHLWTAGFKVWTAILRDYAVKKQNGTYTNPEKMPVLGINK